MFLIVGLGNIGKDFEKTRHNVGFIALDEITNELSRPVSFSLEKKFDAEIAEGEWLYKKVILMKPTTMMNDSGKAVKKIVDFYKLDVKDDLWVIQDEIEMDLGKIEYIGSYDKNRGAKGHNGIRSIINELGTDEFNRAKIGIGKNLKFEQLVSDYVLERFSNEDLAKIKEAGKYVWDYIKYVIQSSNKIEN